MWTLPSEYDVIVIGAGHAGCEAAHASAKMGAKTLLLTMSLDTIGKMSCNPAIGGTAKGHLVREIDALGGIMGKMADRTAIQCRMLNASKGPAVWSPRAQSDRMAYALEIKRFLENCPNLDIFQATVEEIVSENGSIAGVKTQEGIFFRAKSVVLSSGTFMQGKIHLGCIHFPGGRAGDKPASLLSASLIKLGHRLGRLKTGTPPRINSRSIDFSKTEEQPGEEGVVFSFDAPEPRLPQLSCYITYTSTQTKQIILENLGRSAMYSGNIKSVGPRYCPSIEDKMVRFADKERHQIFLEPEGLSTNEIYVNGISSSLPFDVQFAMIRSIAGLEAAEIVRPAYAIEYDYLTSGQLSMSLESKLVSGLFFAGQINGTTGYEEAAGQGLIAGINAACKVLGKDPFILSPSQAYLGVMIEDIISKELTEPYRMFTSRATHRLTLRQDNADLRLRHFGYALGLISEEQYTRLKIKQAAIGKKRSEFEKVHVNFDGKQITLASLVARPEIGIKGVKELFPSYLEDCNDKDILFQIETEIRYSGYVERQMREVRRFDHLEEIKIPQEFSYREVPGLCNEAREKLIAILPSTLGHASRIIGVSAADISILMIALKRGQKAVEV